MYFINHGHRLLEGNRKRTKYNIIDGFCKDAADAQCHHVPKLRVIDHTNDQFAITLHHFRNEKGDVSIFCSYQCHEVTAGFLGLCRVGNI